MTMHNPQTCLSAELLRQLSHDELSPAELADVEDHVSDCERCRQLLEVPQADPQWRDEIVPILRSPRESPHVAGDHDERGGEGESLESILRLLGPTDDPHMLGRIGSYEVVGVIGRGGMGVVFKAYEGALNRFVAIKMLLPHLAASGAARKRFAREGQAAAAVIDDNVMPIYSVAEWQGVPYLVTQYSRGATLQKRIQDQGPLELKEILRIGMQTARGLAAAHAQGLVHRDVKPSNILLDGTVERALLTDFGLARAVDNASITRTGIIAGTPQYMSPEQARGGSVDARSDLFGLGCVLYAMCTGRPPFRADSSYAILRMITDDEPRSIREINSDIPEWLCLLISRLMAKSPDARFGNALEVAALLEQCLAHVQQPTSVPLPASLLPHAAGRRSIFNVTWKGMIAMLGTIGMTLLGMVLLQTTEAPDISGQWTSDEWGTVVLEAKGSGKYEGTFSGTGNGQPDLGLGGIDGRGSSSTIPAGAGGVMPGSTGLNPGLGTDKGQPSVGSYGAAGSSTIPFGAGGVVPGSTGLNPGFGPNKGQPAAGATQLPRSDKGPPAEGASELFGSDRRGFSSETPAGPLGAPGMPSVSDKGKLGTLHLKWSRLERRFNGTWGKGAGRSGTMSLRLVDKDIRGGFTTDEDVQLETGTPLVGDLLWKRSVVTVPDGGTVLLGGAKTRSDAANTPRKVGPGEILVEVYGGRGIWKSLESRNHVGKLGLSLQALKGVTIDIREDGEGESFTKAVVHEPAPVGEQDAESTKQKEWLRAIKIAIDEALRAHKVPNVRWLDANGKQQDGPAAKVPAQPTNSAKNAEPGFAFGQLQRVLNVSQVMKEGRALNASEEVVVVRFQVADARIEKFSSEKDVWENWWVLSSEKVPYESHPLSFRVNVTTKVLDELKKNGIEDIAKHFVGKVLEVEGHVQRAESMGPLGELRFRLDILNYPEPIDCPSYSTNVYNLQQIQEAKAVSPPMIDGAKTLNRENIRSVIGVYVAAALQGDHTTAASVAIVQGKPADPKQIKPQIQAISRSLNLKQLAMPSIYLNDWEHPTGALAISESVTHAEKQRNGERTGFVMLELLKSEENWLVTGVEFRTKDAADEELKRFLEANPSAVDVPPLNADVLPGTESGSNVAPQSTGQQAGGAPSSGAESLPNTASAMPARVNYFTTARSKKIACSADGKLIAIAHGGKASPVVEGWKRTVEILQAETGESVVVIPTTTKDEEAILAATKGLSHIDVGPLAFSPDGTLLAVGTGLGQAKLFDPRTGKLVLALDDEPAKLAEKQTPEKLKSLKRAMGSIGSLAFSPDGTRLAMCGSSFDDAARNWGGVQRLGRLATGPGRLKVWEVKSGTLAHDLAGHSHADAVSFSADGNLLASSGRWSGKDDGTGAIIWDAKTGQQIRTIMNQANGGTHSVVFAPNDNLVAIGSRQFDRANDTSSTTISLTYAKSGISVWQHTMPGWAKPGAFSPDGKTLVVLCGGEAIRFFDIETGVVQREIRSADSPQGGRWYDFALPPHARRMAIGGVDNSKKGAVEIWDFLDPGTVRKKLTDAPQPQNKVDATKIPEVEAAIRWGEPTNGLRLGAKFEGANNQDAMQLRHGDRANIQLFLQNVSDQETFCGFDPADVCKWQNARRPDEVDQPPVEILSITRANGEIMKPEPLRASDGSAVIYQFTALSVNYAKLLPQEIRRIDGQLAATDRKGRKAPVKDFVGFHIVAQKSDEPARQRPHEYVLPNGRHTAAIAIKFFNVGKHFRLECPALEFVVVDGTPSDEPATSGNSPVTDATKLQPDAKPLGLPGTNENPNTNQPVPPKPQDKLPDEKANDPQSEARSENGQTKFAIGKILYSVPLSFPSVDSILSQMAEGQARPKHERIVCELVKYQVSDARDYPLVGPAQLVHAQFRSTITSEAGREVVYSDSSHLVRALPE